MELQAPRKFVLRTTCLKNGGFKHYQSLPPQSVFQHAYWVLGAEVDVRVRQKRAFFNRETPWMHLPVYLTTNKGLMFIYITQDSGYVLRVASAIKVNFESTKKLIKKKPKSGEPKFAYSAVIQLHFQFGEVHLRFNNDDKLRPWRTILLAAHQSQNGVSQAGAAVAKELFRSASMESVVSTKSIMPAPEDKDETDRVMVHRHAYVDEATAEADEQEQPPSASSTTGTSIQSPYRSYASVAAGKKPSPATSNSELSSHVDDDDDDDMDQLIATTPVPSDHKKEETSNESLLNVKSLSYDRWSPVNFSKTLNSEVDVTMKDVLPPVSSSAESFTAAFKTSPTQRSENRRDSIASIASVYSAMFNPEDASEAYIKVSNDKGMIANEMDVATGKEKSETRVPNVLQRTNNGVKWRGGAGSFLCERPRKIQAETIKIEPLPRVQSIKKVQFVEGSTVIPSTPSVTGPSNRERFTRECCTPVTSPVKLERGSSLRASVPQRQSKSLPASHTILDRSASARFPLPAQIQLATDHSNRGLFQLWRERESKTNQVPFIKAKEPCKLRRDEKFLPRGGKNGAGTKKGRDESNI